jgi:hypothetical protein
MGRDKLDPVLREMLLTEARAVAGLDHSAIVPVYDIGRTDTGDYFVVSKMIDGEALAARMAVGHQGIYSTPFKKEIT